MNTCFGAASDLMDVRGCWWEVQDDGGMGVFYRLLFVEIRHVGGLMSNMV